MCDVIFKVIFIEVLLCARHHSVYSFHSSELLVKEWGVRRPPKESCGRWVGRRNARQQHRRKYAVTKIGAVCHLSTQGARGPGGAAPLPKAGLLQGGAHALDPPFTSQGSCPSTSGPEYLPGIFTALSQSQRNFLECL